ncbi:MAG: hypothetical protein NT081_10085 [Actinobacteria bacterium]|nr:hypothetical protein [Actinomycetota bacterium]
MSRFTRSARMAVAGALFLSTAVLFAASPASAAASGDMVNNNDGSMTVTWSAVGFESIAINFYASGTSCPATNNIAAAGTLFYINGGSGMMAPALSASPSLLSAGSAVKIPFSMTPSQISAGSYLACLYLNDGQGNSVLDQSLEITFAVVAPTTTTTTTTAPSTTTTAASTSVAPAFTG